MGSCCTQECNTCKGRQTVNNWIACTTCGGSGKGTEKCTSCNGSGDGGSSACGCNGGQVVVEDCPDEDEGSAHIYGNCGSCGGSGSITHSCGACGGRGANRCKACNGSKGKSETRNCPDCN
eukprot:99327_1